MEWYLKVHNNGGSAATNNVGVLYEHGKGVPQSYITALEWYRNSANQGSGCAMNNVGRYYENGYGVKKDLQFALEWYEQSAEKGYETAKSNIERLNKEGHYYDDKIKKYHVLTKERNEQKSKMKTLEKQDRVDLKQDNTDEQSDTDSSTTNDWVKTGSTKVVKTDEEKS